MEGKIPIRNLSKAPENFLFDIKKVEEMMNGERMEHAIHRHDYFFILALEKGEGTHEIDFESYSVEDGALYFIRPGQVHQLILEPDSKGYLINFCANFYAARDDYKKRLLRKVSASNFYLLEKQLTITPLSDIFTEFSDRNIGFEEAIRSYLSVLFTTLYRSIDYSDLNAVTSYNQEQFEAFKQLVEDNCTTEKSASEYAKMMHISLTKLNRIIKSIIGKTCTQIINDQLILEAKRYLMTTQNNVNEISFILGFEDASYFNRFFKKHTGYTPQNFRNLRIHSRI